MDTSVALEAGGGQICHILPVGLVDVDYVLTYA